jgi:hypothetical protein
LAQVAGTEANFPRLSSGTLPPLPETKKDFQPMFNHCIKISGLGPGFSGQSWALTAEEDFARTIWNTPWFRTLCDRFWNYFNISDVFANTQLYISSSSALYRFFDTPQIFSVSDSCIPLVASRQQQFGCFACPFLGWWWQTGVFCRRTACVCWDSKQT